jgi:methylmalonyl-CoA mutase
VQSLQEQGADDIAVFVGGVVPVQDYPFLRQTGVAGIFGPGTPIPACARQVLDAIKKRA